MSITLQHDQYQSYDEDGETIATRRVNAWNLSEQADFGPGVVFGLRRVEDFEDGIGVDLSVSNDQLEQLGFISKEKIEKAIQRVFPEGTDSYDVSQRSALTDVSMDLGLTNPYVLAFSIDKEPSVQARVAAAVAQDVDETGDFDLEKYLPDEDEQTPFFFEDDIDDGRQPDPDDVETATFRDTEVEVVDPEPTLDGFLDGFLDEKCFITGKIRRDCLDEQGKPIHF